MEQIIQIINQIWEILEHLQYIEKGKREELVDNYRYNLNTLIELIINLGRIADGETPYGRPIQWGKHFWQLHTYKQQHGLTLQAGWEDVVDFGIPLGKVIKVAVPRCSSQRSPLLAPLGQRRRSHTVSDNCQLDYTPRLQRLVLSESVIDTSSQSSSEDGSIGSSESETAHFDIDDLSTDDLTSIPDSIPELEDHRGQIVGGPWRLRIRRARPARLSLPTTPAQARRDLFGPISPQREGQPWGEVLNTMVDEQQNMVFEGTF